MGDEAIEELFIAAHRVGLAQIDLIIAPHDPRQKSLLPVPDRLPRWSEDLYQQIEAAMQPFALEPVEAFSDLPQIGSHSRRYSGLQ